MSKKILIVEDDINIARLESDYLEANNFDVTIASNGNDGLKMGSENEYDLIILDIMLPGVDGFTICQKLRKSTNIPILLVSAKRDDLDKIKGLGFGADDYIVKPFSPSELVARVIAHISRYERLINATNDSSSIINIGTLEINKDSRRVVFDGVELYFTNKEFDLLATLAEAPDTVFDKEELLKKIWNYDSIGDTSTVTVHVNRIREKLMTANANMEFVNTVWGKGYRFYK